MLHRFEHLLDLLQGGHDLFRHSALDLEQRYGEAYRQDALLILNRLEEFAVLHGETLADALAFYGAYVAQVAEDRRTFPGALMAGPVPEDLRFKVQYLYALTLSTALNRSRYELFRDFRQTLEEHVAPGSAILEIGSGNCLNARLASSYGKVRACETNELSLEWRRILDPAGDIDLAIEIYRFDEPSAYDLVMLIEILEHLEDPAAFLADARSVLKEDGLAYLTFAIRMPQIDHLYNFTSIQECLDMVEESGFVVVREQCFVDTLIPFDETDRWRLAEDPQHAVIYGCLARKRNQDGLEMILQSFND